MSKFDSVLAEAAHAISTHGFTQSEFGSTEDGGWNGLVDVSATVLLNLGEHELRDRFTTAHGDAVGGFLVWLREDSQGFVSVVEFGSDSGARSGTDLVGRAFDDASDTHNSDDE